MIPVVDVQALDGCTVADDGASVRLDLRDGHDRPLSLVLPTDHVSALLMTLPGVVDELLRRRDDPTLRLVYPLRHWRVEMADDGATLILSLATTDGFKVSFGVSAGELRAIAASVAGEPRRADAVH